jgi:hypothetical protein
MSDPPIENHYQSDMMEMDDRIHELEAENARLRAELAKSQRDSERLDWWDAHPNTVLMRAPAGSGRTCWSLGAPEGTPIRTAIDAAMAEERPSEGGEGDS